MNNKYDMRILNRLSSTLYYQSKKLSILLIIFLISLGFFSHYSYALNVYKHFELDKDYKEAYAWLNENTNKDDVVLSLSIEQNYLLSVHTHNNVFLPNGILSLTTINETFERFYIANKLFGVDSSYIEYMIDNYSHNNNEYFMIDDETGAFKKSFFEVTYWTLYLFHVKYNIVDGVLDGLEEQKGLIVKEYNGYSESVEDLFSKYRVDYILVGPYENRVGTLNFLRNISTEYGQMEM